MRSSHSLSATISVTVCVVFLVVARGAVAMEKVNANGLIASCKMFHMDVGESPQASSPQASSPQASSCKAYIQGFMAGSREIVAEIDLPSAFMQRALRTRAPGGSLYIDTLKHAIYCLPSDESLRDFAAKVVEFEHGFTDEAGAEKVLLQVLEQNYRCSE